MTETILSDIDLARFASSYPPNQRLELVHQNARARGLWTRLQQDDVPGVLLGDEVGKGKTYVALALAFAQLASKRNARILVLTHSRSMAKTWANRWNVQISEMVDQKWKERFKIDWLPKIIYQYESFVAAVSETKSKPAILFASYDTLKRFHNNTERRRRLLAALSYSYRAHRIRLSNDDRLSLVKDAVPKGGTMPRKRLEVDEKAALAMLKSALDPTTRFWRSDSYHLIEDFLDTEAGRSLEIHPALDLLIVDEAHKLESSRRSRVVTHLLSQKFRKAVWVTATPFAMTLAELGRRLKQFEHSQDAQSDYGHIIDALPLEAFRRAVSSGNDFLQLATLESALRRRMVRSTWNNSKDRLIRDWTRVASGPALLPSMVLERVISNLVASSDRTHIASVRETLCSSWAATLHSLENGALSRLKSDPWVSHLRSLLKDSIHLDPKLREVVDRLVELTLAGEKTVVFTHRTETSVAIVEALQQHPEMTALSSKLRAAGRRWRERAGQIQRILKIPTFAQARAVAKIIAYSIDAPTNASPVELKSWWNKHRKKFAAQSKSSSVADICEFLESIAGKARRLPLVARYDGTVSGGDESESDTVGNDQKFNLPSAPSILVASRKAQEGIDLHHYCRRVVLYDLPWNPALIEQRIGRVHRLGGMRSHARPVEVIYCYQNDSYEDVIAQRIKQRCRMMHALLGAGTWLDQEREVQDLERYRMTFPA